MQRKPFTRGVIASILVPFAAGGEIDADLMRAEVALLDASPVDGICVGGVYSGAAGAPPEELHWLSACVRRASQKPLFAMVFPDTTMEAQEMTRAVIDGGAEIVLMAQPHYLCQPGESGLVDMFADVRESISRPLLLADCFPEAKVDIHEIRSLIDKRLVDGVWQATDIHALVDLLCLHEDIPIYSGIEDLHYIGFMLGAHGAISDLAAVFPQQLSDLYGATQKGNYDDARLCHERLARLWRAMTPPVEREALLRAVLTAQGRKVGPARSPYGGLRDEAAREIAHLLLREGLVTTHAG